MTEVDISSEDVRVYVYEGNRTYTIDHPVKLTILSDDKGDSHRVVDADGWTHRPERGWTGIRWLPRDGNPAFVA